jgi:hypothetical protein
MITRHFYKEDEVFAALLYCVTRGRAREAVFWAQELIDSNLADECVRQLIHSWILLKGIGCLSWLSSLVEQLKKDSLDEEAIILLTYQLAVTTRRDITPMMFALLSFKEYLDIPERLSGSGEVLTWKEGVLRACSQRKARLLWFLLRAEWPVRTEEIWNLLESTVTGSRFAALQDLHFLQIYDANPLTELFIRGLAVGIVCLSTSDLRLSLAPLRDSVAKDVQKSRSEWEAHMGRCIRREYSIPKQCLYWTTDRGMMSYKESTVDELDNLHIDMEKNDYWKTALDGRTFEEMPDEEQIEFCQLYFPDGHPITWSATEKDKSHGPGYLSPGESPRVDKYLRILCTSTESLVVWKGWREAFTILEKSDTIDFSTTTFEELYKKTLSKWKSEAESWNLRTVKKILVI